MKISSQQIRAKKLTDIQKCFKTQKTNFDNYFTKKTTEVKLKQETRTNPAIPTIRLG